MAETKAKNLQSSEKLKDRKGGKLNDDKSGLFKLNGWKTTLLIVLVIL